MSIYDKKRNFFCVFAIILNEKRNILCIKSY